MAAVFLNLFLRRVFLTGAPAFFLSEELARQRMRETLLSGGTGGKDKESCEDKEDRENLALGWEQGKLRGMEWQGTLGNSAGTKDIRNSGMTRRVSVDCFGRSRDICTNEYINNC